MRWFPLLLVAATLQAGPGPVVRCAFDSVVVDWNKRALTNNFYLQPELTHTLIASSAFMASVRASGLYPGGNLLRVSLACGRSYGGTNGCGDCATVGCVEIGGPQLPLIADAGAGRDAVVTLQAFWKYKETGSTGGLGEVTTNNPVYLDTGLIPNNVSSWQDDAHIAVYMMGEGVVASEAMGTTDGGANLLQLVTSYPAIGQLSRMWGVTGAPSSADTTGSGFYLATRVDGTATGLTQYRNGVLTATSSSASGNSTITKSIWVLGLNQNGTLAEPLVGLIGGYTIGRKLTAAQQLSLYQAMQISQTLLSRQK